MNQYNKVAIYGGSFNPVHTGHILTCLSVLENTDYNHIFFIPAYQPSHKNLINDPGFSHRLNMIKLAIEGINGISVNDIEGLKGGVSYTAETLRYFKSNFTNITNYGIIIGDDLLDGLNSWKDFDYLSSNSEFIILTRNGNKYNGTIPIQYVKNRIIEISSTEIRSRIATGKTIKYLVPDKVIDYIQNHNLFNGDK